MNQFKVGDHVMVSGGKCTCDGMEVVVTQVDSDGAVYYKAVENSEWCWANLAEQKTNHILTLVSSRKGIVMSLVSMVRDLAQTKEVKLRRHFNVVDECGNRTSEGTELLLDLLFTNNLTALIDPKLKELEAAEKAEAKK